MSDSPIKLAEVLQTPYDEFLALWDTSEVEAYLTAYGEAAFRDWHGLMYDHLADFRHFVEAEDFHSAYFAIRQLLDEETTLKLNGAKTPGLPLMSDDLYRAVELVSRVDCFLKTLDREIASRGLARSCRDDLTTLLVLADWCDDNSKSKSGSEARHLHAQLRASLRRGPK